MEKKDNLMTIGVCDDSKETQQQVILLIEEYQKKIPQIIQVRCFSSAQELLDNQKNSDLLFLDIELGDDFSGITKTC